MIPLADLACYNKQRQQTFCLFLTVYTLTVYNGGLKSAFLDAFMGDGSR